LIDFLADALQAAVDAVYRYPVCRLDAVAFPI